MQIALQNTPIRTHNAPILLGETPVACGWLALNADGVHAAPPMRNTVIVRDSLTPIGGGCVIAGLLFVLASGDSAWVALAGKALIAIGIILLIRKFLKQSEK